MDEAPPPAPVDDRITVVFATSNRGKLAELRALLADLPFELVSTADVLGESFTVLEDGATFEDNASKKARAVAAATLLVTLADDSGLEIDALGGRPGVRSARFAHDAATDSENNAAVLTAMEEVDEELRTARFRCTLALVDPFSASDAPVVVDGRCEGMIARQPRGSGGFGYDPLFIVRGQERTLAELAPAEKNAVSHRARAVEAMKLHLLRLLAERGEEMARLAAASRGG